MLDVDFEAGGAERLLHGMKDRLDSPDRLLSTLAEDLQAYEREAFDTRGHGTWAPNDPVTVALKGHDRVLVDSGGLLDELTSDSAISTRGEDLTLSTSNPAAAFAKRGARGAPARNPIPEPDGEDVNDWADQLLGYIVTGHRR